MKKIMAVLGVVAILVCGVSCKDNVDEFTEKTSVSGLDGTWQLESPEEFKGKGMDTLLFEDGKIIQFNGSSQEQFAITDLEMFLAAIRCESLKVNGDESEVQFVMAGSGGQGVFTYKKTGGLPDTWTDVTALTGLNGTWTGGGESYTISGDKITENSTSGSSTSQTLEEFKAGGRMTIQANQGKTKLRIISFNPADPSQGIGCILTNQ